MKTEWTQEPHTTVRWALFEALRGADNSSTVDYWDVVTENLIGQLGLRMEWWQFFDDDGFESRWDGPFPSQEEAEDAAARASKNNALFKNSPTHPVHHLYVKPVLVSDWKREDSND